MSQSKCKSSNNIAQQQVVSAEEFSFDLCDKTKNKNEIFIEKGVLLSPEHHDVEETQRTQLSSERDDLQEIPIDFSLPKRIKLGTDCSESFSDQKAHISSSPPLNMSSQRTTSDQLHEVGSDGSKSPPNLYSEHPNNNNSNLEKFANGHVTAHISPDMMVRERSQSFSSLNKIRLHSISHHSHVIPSSSGVGPLSSHHLNDTALIQNVTPPVTYTDLVPQSMPVCTSPTVSGISSLTPDEVLHLYNDCIGKVPNDNCHYSFLSSRVPSCITDTLSRNGMITSRPNVLPSPIPGSTSMHHSIPTGSVPPAASTTNTATPVVTVKSTSPTPTVTTSATTTTAKRRPRSLPDEQKDDAYWERRRKNNEAAKRSRDARRVKEEEIAIRANFLEQENIKLRCEVATLKTETEKLRVLLYEN